MFLKSKIIYAVEANWLKETRKLLYIPQIPNERGCLL